MAAGLDDLIDFLLSEIALCGVQGAGGADFLRFLEKYYQDPQPDAITQSDERHASLLPIGGLGRTFQERVWEWVCDHPDIRIMHKGDVCTYSLSEFEAVELCGTHGAGVNTDDRADESPRDSPDETTQSPKTLLSIRQALREQLAKDKHSLQNHSGQKSQAIASIPKRRAPRNFPQAIHHAPPTFEAPESTITAPRLYASQSRIWQALTGHGIDLKKVPSMEFVLLSLIAARGPNGITQPDLTMISGQDKRSVPHRTNELARKGYIVKNPVQSGKFRTSLCVHAKFVSEGHFLSSAAVEDVFQEGTFVLSGFVQLLYHKLHDAGIVPTRGMRKKLGVPMRTWNKRATQGALIRLDQTGMIKRFRVRKKHTEDSWVTCIQILRAPREEDVNNLGFRRQISAFDETIDELLDEDIDGDTLMRDLEVDMLDDADSELDIDVDAQHSMDDVDRIPPQWTPDKFFANLVFDVIALSGVSGWDSGKIRNRIVGPFWRRPMESYLTRLTDDWEKTQPLPFRHLGIIRDSRNTEEKKFLHYVYRTYSNFQAAVEAGEVHWEGVCKPTSAGDAVRKEGTSNQNLKDQMTFNVWSFHTLNLNEFVKVDGSATLSEVRSAIIHPRKYGSRWDNALNLEIGYQKHQIPITKLQITWREAKLTKQGLAIGDGTNRNVLKTSKLKKKVPRLSLTPEQRISLGLKPHGRLSKGAERQIVAHRAQSGDPNSLPDSIEETPSKSRQLPLMTAEERIAHGLPPRGRLGIARENKIRAERGLVKLVKKANKKGKRSAKEPALLTKEQRLAFGWKVHGRLPQELKDGLREERKNDIPLEESIIVLKYMDILKAKAATPSGSMPKGTSELEAPTEQEASTRSPAEHGSESILEHTEAETNEQPISSSSILGKRKVCQITGISQISRKRRTSMPLHNENSVSGLSPPVAPDNEFIAQVPSHATLDGDSSAMGNDPGRKSMTCTLETEITSTIPEVSPILVRNEVLASDTVEQPPELPAKTSKKCALISSSSSLSLLMKPDNSALNTQDRTVYDLWAGRLMPGLYINPFARHRGGRGRPRKAFIATFRFSSTRKPDWLGVTSNSSQGVVPYASPQISQILMNGSEQSISTPQSVLVANSLLPSSNLLQSMRQTHSSEGLTVQPESAKMAQFLPVEDEKHSRKYVDLIERQGPVEIESRLQPVQDGSELVLEDSTSSPIHHNSFVPDPAASLSVINTSGLVESLLDRDQIPESSSLRSAAASSPELMHHATDINTSNMFRVSPQTPARPSYDCSLLSPGNYSTISEIPTPVPAKPKPRSKKDSNYEGSSLLFRRKIIREIIDLCNGAFPDGGEIGRPFHTLWNQRHGHMTGLKEPIASTVNSTLRNMCHDPKFGLKQMSFLVKNKKGPFTSKKWIITYTHLTPRSPEVVRLAYMMANFSLEKSHQYFPEQIRHLVDDSSLYFPVPIPPKNESMILNQLNAQLEAEKDAKRRKLNEIARQKRLEAKARGAQKVQAKVTASKTNEVQDRVTRTQRTRLASLNDKNTRYTRTRIQQAPHDLLDEEFESQETTIQSSTNTGPTKGNRLVSLRPLLPSKVSGNALGGDADDASKEPPPEPETRENDEKAQATPPAILDLSSSSVPTENLPSISSINIVEAKTSEATNENTIEHGQDSATLTPLLLNPTKRLRGTAPTDRPPKKKARFVSAYPSSASDDEYVQDSSTDSDSSLSSVLDLEEEEEHEDKDEDEDHESEDDIVNGPLRKKTKRQRSFARRQRGKSGPLPTILERLTGLTGDPNDPIYQPPQRKQVKIAQPRARSGRRAPVSQLNKERKTIVTSDPVDSFKKTCFTLVIAASMSRDEGQVDWCIVDKANKTDKFFDLLQMKKLWAWMQTNMVEQLAELTTTFQSSFLEAYNNGKVAPFEDPDTYDWASLVRWTIRKCAYPELPLPLYREALSNFVVDESSYVTLDRARWYKEKIADRMRTQAQLWSTFAEPLHRIKCSEWSRDDTMLKARSWVRANTATPQAIYNGTQAHDKLKILGDSIFTSVVGDYVEKQNLRMRKLKRLLPGRNYNFTRAFAKKFVRPFELNDFMDAIKTKKTLDAAFADEDIQQRFYSIPRCEEDGSLTAIMNLVSDGKVKLVPQLPPVDNEFGAALPRLSVWGFCEGDYTHRAIDRQRLFWDIHVVPTPHYQFGNPLQPRPSRLEPTDSSELADWEMLSNPPLPGKNDQNALLPIWSSIDGQKITWPWWYRILNIVLQPLIFQLGATAADIYAHCPEHTTEMFEVELVLAWLESVHAVRKTISGGYLVSPGFWAAFGDKLIDTKDDWFGEHVKRKAKKHEGQQWRKEYNTQHSTLQTRNIQRIDGTSTTDGDAETRNSHVIELNASKQILQNPRRQYRIMHHNLKALKPNGEKENSLHPVVQTSPAQHITREEPNRNASPMQDLIVPPANDAEIMVERSDDVDAEGEVDEFMEEV